MKSLLVCLLLLCSGLVMAEEEKKPKNYLCIPDYSVGYIEKNGKWQPANFNIEGYKYILKKGEDSIWRWNEFGESIEEDFPKANICKKGFDGLGFINCKYLSDDIYFNRDTLRFMVVYRYGYVVAKGAIEKGWKSETPHMMIGTCSPL